MFRTPIAIIVFNRPKFTQKLVETIQQVKPEKVFVIADGPRNNHSEDGEKCVLTRKIIDEADWSCDVIKNYSNQNLGCGLRVSSGLDWVFEHVDSAIILEDDCIPHVSFFRYCSELLEKYKNDSRVMSISGNNFQKGDTRTDYSYYFSRYIHCWGWATWKRAWKHYDHGMDLWPEIRDGQWLDDILQDSSAVKYWKARFESTYLNDIDTWDYRWTLACWINSGLTVLPNVNLVSNIGFGEDSTHTKTRVSGSETNSNRMDFPLKAPPFLIRDSSADSFTHRHHYCAGSRKYLLKQKMTRIVEEALS
ncbi:MAG: glycosyltransferase family 2 protein [Cyanobacteria bacterium P01_D01_bin.105]